jgi:hypothetical protein
MAQPTRTSGRDLPAVSQTADGDWPAQAADTIESVVGSVRDKTTGPAITVGRGVVYGVFAGITGTAVLVLVCIGAVRALNVYLPDAVFGEDHIWAAYLILGAVFTAIGLFLWSKRTSPNTP